MCWQVPARAPRGHIIALFGHKICLEALGGSGKRWRVLGVLGNSNYFAGNLTFAVKIQLVNTGFADDGFDSRSIEG